MPWGEAIRLAHLLARDTSSALGAALSSWQYPLSREGIALLDIFDRYAEVHYKRTSPYPRPWDPPPKVMGSGSYSTAVLRRILDKHRAEASDG
jgi:hypothetical protein